MINLKRSKEHKWIFQKNISSTEIMSHFITSTSKFNNSANKKLLLEEFKKSGLYRGRSYFGSENTMGVRTSEMKFYMFGYSLPSKPKNAFYLSPMASSILKDNQEDNVAKMSLVNLFSIQYPHPFSNTPSCFRIHAGRLILKLLTDDRIERKMYIDEFCYFIPFIEKIDNLFYEELIKSILDFRRLSFIEKDELFKNVPHYNDVFANVFHEVNYYFLRIFEGLKVFSLVGDKEYNNGHLHTFIHGAGTIRNDAYQSKKKYSGYIKLKNDIVRYAEKLLDSYDFTEMPETLEDDDVLSKEDFILDLYQIKPLKYLTLIDERKYARNNQVSDVIYNMVHMSKYGSRDGKDFEKSLKPVFELFKQTANVEIISGSGDTDLLCAMRNDDDTIYKINIDGKTSCSSTPMLNARRLMLHISLHNSKYCIVVSSRFARGVSNDIMGSKIVAINAETLANYCINEFNYSNDGFIDYSVINEIICNHLGMNITQILQDFIDSYYGITI